MIIHPHGTAIFCDDVRQEINGKTILIGVYRDMMYFQGPPPWQLLNGIRCNIIYRELRGEKLPNLTFEVRSLTASKGEITLATVTPKVSSEETKVEEFRQFEFEKTPLEIVQFIFTAELVPLVVEEPTKLTVLAIRDGEEIFLNRIRITESPKT